MPPTDAPHHGARPDDLCLLGRPRLNAGGRTRAAPGGKALGLLAYVALTGGAPRARLVDLLWSDLGEEAARAYLRQLLYRLRPTAAGALVVADDAEVRLAPGVTVDATRFRAAAAAGDDEAALALYAGPLLDGAEVPGADGFMVWLEAEREALAARHREVLLRRAARLEEGGDARSALRLLTELLRHDELQEGVQRDAMRLHARLGEREAALARFERFRALLRDELGLDPLPETAALAEELRERASVPAPEAPSGAPGELPPAPLVGRDADLAWLGLAGSGNGAGLALLVGEAGVGKTRLALEFARAAGPFAVLRGEELRRDLPYGAVAELLRECAARLADLEPVWRREVGRLLPDLAPDAPSGPPPAEGRVPFLEGLARAVRLATADCGAVVVDDVHWLDDASVEVLAHLGRLPDADGGPRWVATARPEELAERAGVRTWLGALERAGRLARREVGPLSETHLLLLVQRMSGAGGGGLFSRRLFGATGGNPLFVLETLRELHAAGLLTVHEFGWATPFDEATSDYAELPLPDSVREAVVRRVDRLGAPVRRLLEAASLAGDRFGLDEVVGATALARGEAFDALDRATGADLVRLEGDGPVFAHPLVRRSLADALGPARRALVHLRLAAALEAANGAPGRIANHLEGAGQARRAAPWRLKAAEGARAVYARTEALEHFRRALEDGLDDEETVEVRRKQVLLLTALNETAEGLAVTGAWLDLARERGRPDWEAEALACRGQQLYMQGKMQEALAVGEEARAASDRPGVPPRVRGLARRFLGTYLRLNGRPADAEARLREALDVVARPSGEAAFVLDGLTACALARGAVGEATALNAEALAEFEAVGERRGHAIALMTAARLRMLADDPDGCLHFLRLTLAAARRMLDPDLTKRTLTNLALVSTDEGRFDEADAVLRELEEASRDHPAERGRAAHMRALWSRDTGRFDEALAAFGEGVGLADALGDLSLRLARRVDVASLLARLGRTGEARTHLREAARLAADAGGGVPLAVAAEEARAALEDGDPTGALAVEAALEASPAADPTERRRAALVLAEARLARGDPAGALSAAGEPGGGPGARAARLALRLRASAALSPVDPSPGDAERDRGEGLDLLASGRVPALEAMALGAALAAAGGNAAHAHAARLATLLDGAPADVARHLRARFGAATNARA